MSDVITVHLVHLMHPVGSCLGVCLSRTAKSLHSIFHIAECFCLPTGTTGSAVICIYLCSDSKQRIALTDYDKAAIIFLEHTGFIIHISLSFIVRNKIPKSLFFDNIVTYSASEKISKKLELFLLFIFLFPEIYSFKNIFKNHITSLKFFILTSELSKRKSRATQRFHFVNFISKFSLSFSIELSKIIVSTITCRVGDFKHSLPRWL